MSVTLTDECDTGGRQEIRTDESGTRRFDYIFTRQPYSQSRIYLFDGGCATYAFTSPVGSPSLVVDTDAALGFTAREVVVRSVATEENLVVCGAGAPCSA